jgi:hypothetical protein
MQRLLDRLLVTRAVEELHTPSGDIPATESGVTRLREVLEEQAQDAYDAGELQPCPNTFGVAPDEIQCERAAGHDGHCAALLLFPAPKPTA